MARLDGTSPFDSQLAAEAYAAVSSLSIGYQTSITAMVDKGLLPFMQQHPSQRLKIWEYGGGQGKSSWAIDQLLKQRGVHNYQIFVSEPTEDQIIKGTINQRDGIDVNLIVPHVRSLAQEHPIASEAVDIVQASQVDHWVIPKEELFRTYQEAHRILKPGGILVTAVSGLVDLGELNRYHFTRSPFFLEAYLPALEKQLISEGYWRHEYGSFVPWNPNVNPFYHNYTLNTYERNGLPLLISSAGFSDVETIIFLVCLDGKEMEARMTNLAMLNMHLFQGKPLKSIRETDRDNFANSAFIDAKTSNPKLWSQLESQSRMILKGLPEQVIYGEPVPVLIAKK